MVRPRKKKVNLNNKQYPHPKKKTNPNPHEKMSCSTTNDTLLPTTTTINKLSPRKIVAKKKNVSPKTHKDKKISTQRALEQFLIPRQTRNDPERTHQTFPDTNGYAMKFGQATPPFKITESDRDEFYQLYTECYNAGVHLPFIEQKLSAKWPFFMDCDGKSDTTPTILQHITEFKDALRDDIIPNALKFVFDGDEKKQFKIEIHNKANDPARMHIYLVCQFNSHNHVIVNEESGAAVREKLIELSQAWSETKAYGFTREQLNKFVDPIMATKTGLRMYGSRKAYPDRDYVQPGAPVSIETLKRYSIHPQGISTQTPTPICKKAERWWQTAQSQLKKINKQAVKACASKARVELLACAASAKYGALGDPLIADCAQRHNIPIEIKADGKHIIKPKTCVCPVCQRTHESEHAILFRSVVGIKCFCYRAHNLHFDTVKTTATQKTTTQNATPYVVIVEHFPRPIPMLEGLLDNGAMYWAEFLLEELGPNIRVCGDKHAVYFVYMEDTRLWSERDGSSLVRKRIYENLLPQLQRSYDILKTKQALADGSSLDAQYKRAIYQCSDTTFLQKIAESFKSFKVCQILEPAKVFNQLKEEIAVKNGQVINMQTLTLRDRTRDDLFTQEIPYEFEQHELDHSRERSLRRANMTWEEIFTDAKTTFKANREQHPPNAPEYYDQLFFDDVFALDRDRVPYNQRICGAGLTGYTERQTFEGFYGVGSNFKSMMKKLLELTGPFCKTINYESLCLQNSQNNDELYHAAFARTVTFSESNIDKEFNWFLLLRLTGGEKYSPAAKFLSNREYRPMFNVIGFFNDPPQLPKKLNLAHKRRIRNQKMRKIYLAAPGQNAIDDAERSRLTESGKGDYIGQKDPDLEQKLMTHAVGWLLWQLEGAHYYINHNHNIPTPESIDKKLKKHFVEDDYTPAKFFESNYKIATSPEDGNNVITMIDIQEMLLEYNRYDGKGRINKALNVAAFSKAIRKVIESKGHVAETIRRQSQRTGTQSTWFKNIKRKDDNESKAEVLNQEQRENQEDENEEEETK